MKIGIIAGKFPKYSETFILGHVTSLLDLGQDVDVFSMFHPKKEKGNHPEVEEYQLLKKTHYFVISQNRFLKSIRAVFIFLKYVWGRSRIIFQCLDLERYSPGEAIDNLIKVEPFLKKSYDVIHCHFGHFANEFVFIKELFPQTRLFVTFHGYDIRKGIEKGNSLYRDLFDCADGILSICEYNRKVLIQLGCPESKIHDLPNAVDLNKFQFTKREKKDKFHIVTLARFAKVKNYEFALKIMSAMQKEGRIAFQYDIIGHGKLKDKIQRWIEDYELQSCVRMWDNLSQIKIRQKLAESDVFLLSSKNEGLPVVLLEAQAMGIPVIATNVGGVNEALKDGETGYLIPLDQVEEAKDCFYSLFQNFNRISTMGLRARELMEEKFCRIKITQKLIQLYNRKEGERNQDDEILSTISNPP